MNTISNIDLGAIKRALTGWYSKPTADRLYAEVVATQINYDDPSEWGSVDMQCSKIKTNVCPDDETCCQNKP